MGTTGTCVALEAHSSDVVPDAVALPSRGAAVKDGHFGRPQGLVLDGREHGGKLDTPGMMPACLVRDHRLPWLPQHQTA